MLFVPKLEQGHQTIYKQRTFFNFVNRTIIFITANTFEECNKNTEGKIHSFDWDSIIHKNIQTYCSLKESCSKLLEYIKYKI